MGTGEQAGKLPALTFRSQPGGLNARFYHSIFDYIELDLRMGGDTTWVQEVELETTRTRGAEKRFAKPSVEYTVCFSSLSCAFPGFIRFLEAITIGVEECAFSWNAEGPDGRMQWNSSGRLRLQWSTLDGKIDQTTSVRAHDVVETLYTAFRLFVDSPDYDPLSYEHLQVWDAYSLVLADAGLGDLARAVAKLPAAEAGAVLMRASAAAQGRGSDASSPPAARHPLEWYLQTQPQADITWSLLPDAWNTWSEARRKRHVGRRWARTNDSAWFGTNLRRLRSERIEAWLALKGRA